MAKRVWKCGYEKCGKIFEDEQSAEKCEASHTVEGLADFLHKKLCRWNHTDGCSYEYGSWESRNEERTRWLIKAQEFKHFAEKYKIPDQDLYIMIIRMSS